MKQATALNMGSALKNLAERKDVSHFSADKLLDVLKTNGGLVNKAKAALLGARAPSHLCWTSCTACDSGWEHHDRRL